MQGALQDAFPRPLWVRGERSNLRMYGSQQYVVVRSVREHQLSQHMAPPLVKDFSKFLICPMPGSLISLDCHAGQAVTVGQALATVEAMKMQVGMSNQI